MAGAERMSERVNPESKEENTQSPGFRSKCLCLDLETDRDDPGKIYKVGAWRADTGDSVYLQGQLDPGELHSELGRLIQGAAFILGHNITAHDLPALRQAYPGLTLLKLPIIDTLWLSPLAFPQNPYHSLVKDYKLVRDSRSDPLKDARLAFRLFHDQIAAFEARHRERPAEVACYHFLLADVPDADYDRLFTVIRGKRRPDFNVVQGHFLSLCQGKVCTTRLRKLVDEDLPQKSKHLPLAYVLAWLQVAGGNSVLPPWVRHRYPETIVLSRELRDQACSAPDCAYCRQYHDPRKELERYFGFTDFRPEPANATGGSLQADIVRAGMARENLLAILPTGGGKSLCYQLPALSRYFRDGSLTIVISPLQSLMKDQVDNLVKRGIFCAAALNGLLSMPERRDVLEKIRLGDIGILLVSPEQFRNRSFTEAIRHRQIAAFVFDEAHCLSKWGHDFRTDYLYVSRFIREHYGDNLPPVACFTATAKLDVIEDLEGHFREELGIGLKRYIGGHERTNLHFEVLPVKQAEKYPLIHSLLDRELKQTEGGAIVFAARRRSAEEIATFLKDMGWACAHFHAGLEPGQKKEIQQAFIDGELKVIVATNAFGMGVDKPDVRVVIHAEIPGSLENYLQEAGRAGRDRLESRCILLYDEEDVETQFRLAARSRLSRRDIAEILRTLRRRANRIKAEEIVITPGEILAEEDLEANIDHDNPDADTKIKTAIAWLERRRFLLRNENRTRVFPASLKLPSLEAVEKRLRKQDLSEDMRHKYLNVVSIILNADADEGISTDELMVQTGFSSDECIRILHGLSECGVLSNDLSLTVLVRKGVKSSSRDRFQRIANLEQAILELLPELAPDAEDGDWQEMHIRTLCQELNHHTGLELIPDEILTLMRTMARAFGDGQARRALFDLRVIRRDYLRVRLQRPWRQIQAIAEKRRSVAQCLLNHFLEKVAPGLKGVDLRVECKLEELTQALKEDLELVNTLKDIPKALEQGLLYLHDTQVLIVDKGKTVFRSAMTIRIQDSKRRFTRADYDPLEAHYREKNLQVHVMQEYARRGLDKIGDALAFVAAYFTLPKKQFVRRYFTNRREILDLATTEESYRRIVTELNHPVQEEIVADRSDLNRLVLAGPGSGKTRVVVHRVAFFLRVLRIPAEQIAVLTFNRAAAREVRQRLRDLVGSDAYGVTVLTYHAMALRLTGSSLQSAAEAGEEIDLEAVLKRAIDLLEGKAEAGLDPDELRDRLLRGYRYILVDEYQDIDEAQYRLVSALAGRTLQDKDAKLTILAVGDDDQNIYAFRNTNVAFIRRFERDYEAETTFLVENYRSTQHIISAANEIIQRGPNRLKVDHPIRINHARMNDPPGGCWERLDTLVRGRVHVLQVPADTNRQAQLVMAEVERLRALDPESDWSDFAILARTHAALQPIRAWCEWKRVPYLIVENGRDSGMPQLHQTREGHHLIRLLKTHGCKLIRPGALSRWHRRNADPGNPWQILMGQCIDELEAAWKDTPVPVSQALEWIYEYGIEARQRQQGRLNLSTVHGAKGGEFKHVVILDTGDWQRDDANGEERRLYYVGMTRAMETLTLCEAKERSNPFSRELEEDEFLLRTPLTQAPQPLFILDKRYKALGLADVDLGFAGRKPEGHPIHAAIGRLKVGDPLQLVETNGHRELRTLEGTAVGRLSRRCQLPPGQVESMTVSAIVRRTRKQCQDLEYRKWCKVDVWEVVLAELKLS